MELLVGTPEEIVKWLFTQPRDKVFSISEYRKKRSLDANRYAWVLINEIANVLRTSKDEIYQTMLKRYGQSDMVSVIAEVNVAPYFKYYEEIGEADLQGKHFKHYRVFKGSSEYDSREMSILIDGIISEAKELGINTMTPAEVAKLKEMWRNNEKHNH